MRVLTFLFLPLWACGGPSGVVIDPAGTDDPVLPTTGEVVTTPTLPDGVTSIIDIQQGLIEIDTEVTIRGVVTAAGTDRLFVQQPPGGAWSGIEVDTAATGETAEPGDEVEVTGTYVEDSSGSEVAILTEAAHGLVQVGSAPIPDPEALIVGDLADPGSALDWEGVLVTVADPMVSDVNAGPGRFVVGDPTWSWDLVVADALHEMADVNLGTLPVGYAFQGITGVVDTNQGTPLLLPRTMSDCDEHPPASNPPGGQAVMTSIYDIQGGAHAEGTLVAVDMVCVMGVADDGVYVQHSMSGPRSGLFLHLGLGGVPGNVAQGDVVDVTGVYVEVAGMSWIDASQTGGISPGNMVPLPAPESVSVAELANPGTAESWEGVLIGVANLDVSDPLVGTGEFELIDALGSATLRVDDRLHRHVDFDSLQVSDHFLGVIGHLAEAGGVYRVHPRDDGDLLR